MSVTTHFRCLHRWRKLLSPYRFSAGTSNRHRNAHWFWSGFETLLLGGTCAVVAFTIGYYVNGLLGDDAIVAA